jgi:uncharacterized protein YkwD
MPRRGTISIRSSLFCAIGGTLVASTLLAVSPAARAADTRADRAYATRLGELVNQYRARHDLPPLAADDRIAALARDHSADMARDRQLHHDGFPSRVKRSGRPMCVENVGWNYPTPQAQLDAWRASPGHDRNLLDRRVDRVGIGAADGYVTLIGCGP